MTTAEIAIQEDAARAAMATWSDDAYEGEHDLGYFLQAALAPAVGILAVAAALLFMIV